MRSGTQDRLFSVKIADPVVDSIVVGGPITLTIELTPEEEARLIVVARQQGKVPVAVLVSLLGTLPDAKAERAITERTWGAITLSALADLNSAPPSASMLPPMNTGSNLVQLFADWNAEDAALTLEEYAGRELDWQTFRQNMNTARLEAGAEEIF